MLILIAAIQLVSRCSASIVYRCVAKQSLVSSSAVAAKGSLASRKRLAVGVIRYTRRMPLAAIASVLSITAMYYLT
jgi:hypothetical protein